MINNNRLDQSIIINHFNHNLVFTIQLFRITINTTTTYFTSITSKCNSNTNTIVIVKT